MLNCCAVKNLIVPLLIFFKNILGVLPTSTASTSTSRKTVASHIKPTAPDLPTDNNNYRVAALLLK